MPHLARNQISRTDLRKILDAPKKPHDPNAITPHLQESK